MRAMAIAMMVPKTIASARVTLWLDDALAADDGVGTSNILANHLV